MTDQAMLAEMARLLAIIERYWATHFSASNEIDALTTHRVRAPYSPSIDKGTPE
jgi:hypothetical protein